MLTVASTRLRIASRMISSTIVDQSASVEHFHHTKAWPLDYPWRNLNNFSLLAAKAVTQERKEVEKACIMSRIFFSWVSR